MTKLYITINTNKTNDIFFYKNKNEENWKLEYYTDDRRTVKVSKKISKILNEIIHKKGNNIDTYIDINGYPRIKKWVELILGDKKTINIEYYDCQFVKWNKKPWISIENNREWNIPSELITVLDGIIKENGNNCLLNIEMYPEIKKWVYRLL